MSLFALRPARQGSLSYHVLKWRKIQVRSHSGPLYKNVKGEDPAIAPEATKRSAAQATSDSATSNPHRQFYRSFGFPVLKVALGSMLTYQVIYWSWLKLQSLEEQEQISAQESGLKTQIVQAVKERSVTK